jgi:hypothetical protein
LKESLLDLPQNQSNTPRNSYSSEYLSSTNSGPYAQFLQQQQQQQPPRKAYVSITKLDNNNNNNFNNTSDTPPLLSPVSISSIPHPPPTASTNITTVSSSAASNTTSSNNPLNGVFSPYRANSSSNNPTATPTTINSNSNQSTTSIKQEPAYNRDITKDLFSNFERTTLLSKRESSNASSASQTNNNNSLNLTVSGVDNVTVTEASYVGNVKIHEVNKNGYFVRLLNLSNTVDEDLSNYTLQQMVSAMPVAVFRIPSGTKLAPGHTMTVWSRTDEVAQQPPHTFVWAEQERWGTGPECTTILAKPNGQAVSWTTGCHKYGNIGK